MSSPFKPSLAGRFKYARTGGYYRLRESDETRFPCRCKPDCTEERAGGCGCFACRVAEADRKPAIALKAQRGEPPV